MQDISLGEKQKDITKAGLRIFLNNRGKRVLNVGNFKNGKNEGPAILVD